MNKGDANWLFLNIKINGSNITQNYADEIELTFNKLANNSITKSLQEETIVWDITTSKFKTFLSQEETFKFNVGINNWQIRILKDDNVISNIISTITIGDVNSRNVLKEDE